MNTLLLQSLDRTLLLMRDELRVDTSDDMLAGALTATEVVLVCDSKNLISHAAQCAFVTTAILMARSGHRVYLLADDVFLVGNQPPLTGKTLMASLVEVGNDLLPGINFQIKPPLHVVDLCVRFGDSQSVVTARRVIHINASPWSAFLSSSGTGESWIEKEWPFGALAAAALAAGEAFKMAMHKLRDFARQLDQFDQLFAVSERLQFHLAPSNTSQARTLGNIDFVSGGAITNAALYALARILDVTSNARVIEPGASDLTNLNRYMLLRRSQVTISKTSTLRSLTLGNIDISELPIRFEEGTLALIGELSPHVLVGVDHIPSRWIVQKSKPHWVGVGATTHWNAMSSFHREGLACAWCLHPRDDLSDAPIPTIAFVSFWSGLLLAAQFVRAVIGEDIASREQQVFLTPLRMEMPWWSPVARRPDCLICNQQNWNIAA